MKKHLFTVALGLPLLVGCFGYQPMYKNNDVALTIMPVTMTSVKKNEGERRVAQTVSRILHRKFPKTEAGGDVLTLTIKEITSTLAVKSDASVQRSSLSLRGQVRLTDKGDNIKFRTTVSISSAYNVENTPLSTDVGRNYARQAAAESLAEEISRRIYQFYAQQAR